jgi:cobalt-zinc-cadmium efflux system membrane fusion protein
MRNAIYILLILVSIWSCGNKDNIPEEVLKSNTSNNVVALSTEQIEMAKIKTGTLKRTVIYQLVQCTGAVKLKSGNKAMVSPLLNGFVKDIVKQEGAYVKTGETIMRLEHSDFIKLQQQFMESQSQVRYYENEFKRQGELTVENAASVKIMQKAEADYWSANALYKSTKAQLEMLGVNVANRGEYEFAKEFNVIAPITGCINNINVVKGMLVEPKDIICQIINNGEINLHLSVFEKDIHAIKSGQKVEFWLPNNDSKKFIGRVVSVGQQVDDQMRSTKVVCSVEAEGNTFREDMFVQASILIDEREVWAVPETAVFYDENNSYIFVQTERGFLRKEINVGITQSGLIEVVDPEEIFKNSEIVINGGYYLMSAIQLSE